MYYCCQILCILIYQILCICNYRLQILDVCAIPPNCNKEYTIFLKVLVKVYLNQKFKIYLGSAEKLKQHFAGELNI